ncbi:ankyrin repeat domain-containing protein SOWAHC-like [Centruroides vittatus]|uniref:ankyrin repeat domain-containing protein SOWAHC-like n=1 Tax=Centruroides vittatus TaxID=120091 RepID=UPI00350ED08B
MMDEQNVLTFDSVRDYLFQNGGKVNNRELVKHFQSYLTNPDLEKQAQAKLHFRDYINELATLKEENGVKYVVMRKKYLDNTPVNVPKSSPANTEIRLYPNGVWPQGRFQKINETVVGYGDTNAGVASSVARCDDRTTRLPVSEERETRNFVKVNHSEIYQNLTPTSEAVPQPPPRRRGDRRESSGKIEETLRQLNKENSETKIIRNEALTEPIISPGMVRERAQSLNKLASETELTIKSPSRPTRGNVKVSLDDDDTSSLASLNPYRREWTLKAAQGDYLSLVRLLKEEPRLANFKDFISVSKLLFSYRYII